MHDTSLKVLVVGAEYPFQTFLARLFEGLLKRGLNLTIACEHKPDYHWLRKFRVTWVRTPGWNYKKPSCYFLLVLHLVLALTSPKKATQLMNPTTTKFSFREWVRQIYLLAPFLRGAWDVVYFPWIYSGVLYGDLFRLGIPTVTSCRGSQINIDPYLSRKKAYSEDLRLVFSKVTKVHCVSQDILKQAMRYGLETQKTQIIYPAVDPNFFVPATHERMRRGRLKLVSTGSLISFKGYESALIAFKILLENGIDAEYEIIGEGPERDHLEFSIHDMRLDGRAKLLGYLTPEKVRECLQAADIFVHASVSEGVANSALEAMACGLPVVVTDSGGMKEVVRDNKEGMVVPVRNAHAMAEALSRLQKDPAMRLKMGHNARQRVLEKFNLEAQITQFLDLFNACSGDGNSNIKNA